MLALEQAEVPAIAGIAIGIMLDKEIYPMSATSHEVALASYQLDAGLVPELPRADLDGHTLADFHPSLPDRPEHEEWRSGHGVPNRATEPSRDSQGSS